MEWGVGDHNGIRWSEGTENLVSSLPTSMVCIPKPRCWHVKGSSIDLTELTILIKLNQAIFYVYILQIFQCYVQTYFLMIVLRETNL